MSKPLIAIVGRPNVGKSALFNRLARKRIALVEDFEGTTRDRLYTDIDIWGRACTLIDTGGFDNKDKEGYTPRFWPRPSSPSNRPMSSFSSPMAARNPPRSISKSPTF